MDKDEYYHKRFDASDIAVLIVCALALLYLGAQIVRALV